MARLDAEQAMSRLATGSSSSYAPMVKYLACRKVRELPAHCELDDLVSCGLLALIAAVDRFDPAKGATFEQYAWTRVVRRDHGRAAPPGLGAALPAPLTAARSSAPARTWQSRTGRAPSDEELATELEIDVSELHDQLEGLSRADLLSLNTPARGNEEAMPVEVGDTIEAPSGRARSRAGRAGRRAGCRPP